VRGADRRAEKAAERSAEKSTNRRAGTSHSDRRKSAKRKTAAARSLSKQRELFPQPAGPSTDRKSDHLSDRLSVTVSIGVAEPSTRIRQPEQVIQSADQALYRAKNEGRNRVELASTAPLRVGQGRRSKASRL
jgi:GGDEF domain-containing protein